MEVKEIKDKLKKGKTTIGSWIQLPDASSAEIMGQSGYDWVAVDLEHGSISLSQLPDLFRAIQLGGSVPFVRVARNDPKDIKQALDAGAHGLIVPMVESREDVVRLRSASQYPPVGARGVGFSRANLYGKYFDSAVRHFHEECVLVAQVEHKNAVSAIDAILSEGRIDAIMIGPYDLSASYGTPGDFHSKEFLNAMDRIKEACKKYTVPLGRHIVMPDTSLLRKSIEEGFQFIAYGIDAVFLWNSSSCPVTEIK